jgi:hypothetical protein
LSEAKQGRREASGPDEARKVWRCALINSAAIRQSRQNDTQQSQEPQQVKHSTDWAKQKRKVKNSLQMSLQTERFAPSSPTDDDLPLKSWKT